DAAIRTLLKLSGVPYSFFDRMNIDAFIEQGREYSEDDGMQGALYKFILTTTQTHPWPAVRAYELKKWIDDGSYRRLLEWSGSSAETPPGRCGNCTAPVSEGDRFCQSCGSRTSRP